jgi:hypothetical protein
MSLDMKKDHFWCHPEQVKDPGLFIKLGYRKLPYIYFKYRESALLPPKGVAKHSLGEEGQG